MSIHLAGCSFLFVKAFGELFMEKKSSLCSFYYVRDKMMEPSKEREYEIISYFNDLFPNQLYQREKFRNQKVDVLNV
jgi:hypothetical protein